MAPPGALPYPAMNHQEAFRDHPQPLFIDPRPGCTGQLDLLGGDRPTVATKQGPRPLGQSLYLCRDCSCRIGIVQGQVFWVERPDFRLFVAPYLPTADDPPDHAAVIRQFVGDLARRLDHRPDDALAIALGAIEWAIDAEMDPVLGRHIWAWHDEARLHYQRIIDMEEGRIAPAAEHLDSWRFVWNDPMARRLRKMPRGKFLKTAYWQCVRAAVFDRDGGACQVCGAVARLHCHHKHYRHSRREHDHLDDLATLCRVCHAKLHAAGEIPAAPPMESEEVDAEVEVPEPEEVDR